uniref:Uncharacterized protein LOC100178423 n=1 Tax=Phallusia mammillata TaxID=59560 RepID=A0A6F9DHC0_9ASCI|nr:uncharacterized protein LOC100178423 [Phallusia mammillata]
MNTSSSIQLILLKLEVFMVMPSPSRIPRCKPKTVKNASTSEVKPNQPEVIVKDKANTRLTNTQKRNVKQPIHVLNVEKSKSESNIKRPDRRGITEIKRSESALIQKLLDLENTQQSKQKELDEKNTLLEQFTASEAHLTKEIEQLKSQYTNLCISMEKNGYDPITSAKIREMECISAEVENSEKHAKIDAEEMIKSLLILDKLCDDTTEKLKCVTFPISYREISSS